MTSDKRMSIDTAEALKDWMRADLNAAMRARRPFEVRVLRTVSAAIDNAEAVPDGGHNAVQALHRFDNDSSEVPRRKLLDADIKALRIREIAICRASAEVMARAGRVDRSEELQAEAQLIARYVPE